ncbi:hypothetical protein EVAR_42653_1 [Eumeta japonica]|uniref:Uncharacterized protein n=1 Tax=Eumeta variegata TaxID=151549 RepID=A0A4C1YP71_EUMVA|nr:hypothetical protein EVAR_42653_1 [Eumeta japonica]
MKKIDVCELVKDKRLDLLCVNETKRKGSGRAIKSESFDTYWSGVDQSQRACRGVGFILSERLSECVNGYECISPKLLWLQVIRHQAKLVTAELEQIKVGKHRNQNVKDEYAERSKDSLDEIKQYERLELDGLWKVAKSVLIDEAKKDTVADDDVTAPEYMLDDGNECEIVKALKRMKVEKAAGYDRVSSEMLSGDIEKRVNAGNKANGALFAITKTKSVSRQARLAIHNGVSLRVCMVVKAGESRALPQSSAYEACNKIRNEEICTTTRLTNIDHRISKLKWQRAVSVVELITVGEERFYSDDEQLDWARDDLLLGRPMTRPGHGLPLAAGVLG